MTMTKEFNIPVITHNRFNIKELIKLNIMYIDKVNKKHSKLPIYCVSIS